MESFIHYFSMYLVIVTPLLLVIYLIFRFVLKIKDWYVSDAAMLLVPGVIYLVMDEFRLDRLIANARAQDDIKQSMLVGITCAAIFLGRCILSRKKPASAKKISYITLAAMTVITVIIFLFAPPFSG